MNILSCFQGNYGDITDEYCPGNIIESSDDNCSSGVDEAVANGNHPSDSSEECMEVTPSSKTSTPLPSSTPRRSNGIKKKRSSITPSQLNHSVNVRNHVMLLYVIVVIKYYRLYHHPLGAMLLVVMENLLMKDLNG